MFSKINAWLHLWLGLVSGIAVFIISITGCVLVFEIEIKALTSSWLSVDPQPTENQLPPSVIYDAVSKALPEHKIYSTWYYGLDQPVKVSIDSDSLIYVNPYTAEILAMVDHEDFFHFIEEGHLYLWFPPKIGRQVVGWSTFIFFFLLISGLILWFPSKWNKTNRDKSFKIKWKAKFKRLNYDLHNVLGFYALILALVMTITGLIMSFPWMRQSVYWLANGGEGRKPRTERIEEEKPVVSGVFDPMPAVDQIWKIVRTEVALKNKEAVILHFPEEPGEAIYACTDMDDGSWRDLYFDQQTLELLPSSQKAMGEESFANWLMRANFGLHTGYIGGMYTKILYFLASLISASLPITGLLVWLGKKKKAKRAKKQVMQAPLVTRSIAAE
ncbi:putative iron-regulated membrane protein [Algoriphagus sp. 4150]|uniref:PepSY-associated TM helix domain-containing protein n=1 Tax=Algoriphagus sp. 4150 TaxID=2817756 RepID=UPI002865AC8C|nr:PepSY-associated TM helix domain-containing protein [Algoriphagus sp. 4150]MDR7129556.1 putative iron-regulated membrane protein [Algoriphagus sp. 4150]